MISVEFYYDPYDKIKGFNISGHAGYDEAGKDIICSAVSVLAINTINSIEELCSDNYTVDQNEEEGSIRFMITDDIISDSSQILLKSLRLGLDGIISSYGNDYVTIVS